MGLVGNLEDLGLGDILQIISLSRKSGVLSLHSRGREGKIIFLHGRITRASASVFRENLGDLLLRKGLVDVETLKRALLIQEKSDPPSRIGTILASSFGISKDAIEELVKTQVSKIVCSFFGWIEGTFSFELGEPGEMAATNFNPLQFMLEQGLNPHWLAMEGSHVFDEKHNRREPLRKEAESPAADTERLFDVKSISAETPRLSPPFFHTQVPSSIFLVDDDSSIREGLDQVLRERGYAVKNFGRGGEFLTAVETAVKEGMKPVLLIDLIMPRRDGSGILGGFELLERVREKFPNLTVLMMSDYPNEEAERKARQLGVSAVISKPKKGQICKEQDLKVLEALVDKIAPLLADVPAIPKPLASGLYYDFGEELLGELGESDADTWQGKGPESPGLHLLKGMLQELNSSFLGGGVTLLVLRFASKLMNRAVIFQVKEKEIVGFGQFGIESMGEMADDLIRSMKIPRGEESVFCEVLKEMAPMKTRLSDSRWDVYLKGKLGGGWPSEIFLGPIVSGGKVVAVIYGDNLPEDKPIGDTETLEIFLSQAGLAMEKAFLESRLKGTDAMDKEVRDECQRKS
jgi:CheY-like chemotaxis protein